jgi:hypothetical protein
VRVDPECEARVGVPEVGRQRLDVLPRVQHRGLSDNRSNSLTGVITVITAG